MERSFETFILSKVLVKVVVGPGFRVAGRRQEVTAKSQASGLVSFHGESRRQRVGHGWLDVEDRPTPHGAGAAS